jgi:hypothetical protein
MTNRELEELMANWRKSGDRYNELALACTFGIGAVVFGVCYVLHLIYC